MQSGHTHFEKLEDIADGAPASEQHLREFMEAYREDFGEDLSPGEASVMLTQLVQLYLHISRPSPPTSSPSAPRSGETEVGSHSLRP